MPDSERKYADFGARQVPLGDKQALVDDVFRSVARRYDLMNDLMSFGLHRAWKDALVTAVNPPKNRPFALLDIAGGTGDIAMRVVAAGGAQTRATVCDINSDMLAPDRKHLRVDVADRGAAVTASGGDNAHGDVAGPAGDIEKRERTVSRRVHRSNQRVLPGAVQPE